MSPEDTAQHRALARYKTSLSEERKLTKSLSRELELSERANELLLSTNVISPKAFKRAPKLSKGDASALMLMTDWHVEEHISKDETGGLNEFNLKIADERIRRSFEKQITLFHTTKPLAKINEVVLWLGGDLINGYIHEEMVESNFLGPAEAIIWLTERLTAGIDLIRKSINLPLRVVCNIGNHSRSTKDRRVATAYKSNWEYLMYHNLSKFYAKNSKISWYIPKGYFAELTIQKTRVRFHHGDQMRAGRNFVASVLRDIDMWNKTKPVDLDIFGHYHTELYHNRFISVGCLVGYNAYAQMIKAEYQPPTQTFAIIEKSRGLILTMPVFCEKP